MKEEQIKKIVREGYAKIAKGKDSCCGRTVSCCNTAEKDEGISRKIGYREEELASVPEGADLGLGCGNPVESASLKEGETVLDLGSGAGLDCLLAANLVGEKGRAIGVDMTPEMIDKARENARSGKYGNVEFRLGEIENLPVADNIVDVVISNCVINLSPNKRRVFEEAFRVLRPGGRITISDIVLLKELPGPVKESVEAYVGCLSGAITKDEYIKTIKEAGFQEVRIIKEVHFPVEHMINDPTAKAVIEDLNIRNKEIEEIADSIASMTIQGTKTPRKIGS